jgi:DNA polymerase-3 subunit epsilon
MSHLPAIDDTLFVVVDVETTGLFPNNTDRIVEFAAIQMLGNGEILNSYVTLVNPNRDLGATHIHGITAREVKGAPSFKDIAGDVLAFLAGDVFVAHNVSFDYRFLEAEFARLGCTLPKPPLLCTMRLSKMVDQNVPGRTLGACCAYFGVPHESSHSAYHDAFAAAKLLEKELLRTKSDMGATLYDIGISDLPKGRKHWPKFAVTGISYTRSDAAGNIAKEIPYVTRLVSRLPSKTGIQSELDDYLALLDRVLEDRRIEPHEVENLFNLALDLGMSRDQAQEAHHEYMRDLIRLALADGIITELEQQDLEEVASLLCLSKRKLEELVCELKNVDGISIDPCFTPSTSGEIAGKSVCFTGQMLCKVNGEKVSRSMAQKIAEENGMIVKKGVTMDLDILVMADPESMSGKAKKARKYGSRIIAETVFWRMVGVEFE